jgi:membrane-associated protease RseP (regulator of RpoE activity)
MIIIALIFHKLGHYCFIWITKVKLNELRTQSDWRRVIVEMGGVITNFVLAFLIIFIITITGKEKYLLNENAIYGVEFSDVLKNIGFENGDKIISINNQKVVLFSDIIKSIIIETGDVKVVIQSGNVEKLINISESDKLDIMRSSSTSHITPIIRPDSVSDLKVNYLRYNERQQGIADAFEAFSNSIQISLSYLSPIQSISGFIAIKKASNIKGFFYLLALSSLFIGFVNLIPLPGMDIGNALIALVEKSRKRNFNGRKLKIIRIVGSSLIVIILLASI